MSQILIPHNCKCFENYWGYVGPYGFAYVLGDYDNYTYAYHLIQSSPVVDATLSLTFGAAIFTPVGGSSGYALRTWLSGPSAGCECSLTFDVYCCAWDETAQLVMTHTVDETDYDDQDLYEDVYTTLTNVPRDNMNLWVDIKFNATAQEGCTGTGFYITQIQFEIPDPDPAEIGS